MTQLLTIEDNKIVIKTLVLESTAGAVSHDGSFAISQSATIAQDLTVSGTVTAGTIRVQNLITDSGTIEGVGQWTVNTEDELNGKGLGWTWGNGTTRLMYRNGGRIWTNGDIDLAVDKTYKIDNIPVIGLNALGAQVKKSNLTEVGSLKSLNVLGNTTLGEFAFFNSTVNRLGLNTEEPNGAFSVVENSIEIVIDSPNVGQAVIGTYTNHDVSLISDNTPRLTAKSNGEIHIGNEESKKGVLRVFGTIYADNLISDTRLERTSSLEFKDAKDNTMYGKGLAWISATSTKQLMLKSGPDRLFSTESIDIGSDKQYYINSSPVLSAYGLGPNVVNSHLTSLGALQTLTVNGESTFLGDVSVDLLKTAGLSFKDTTVSSNTNITINIQNQQALYVDQNEIEIGDKLNTRRTVKIYGPLSVGISNPDPTVDLAVRGNISFADRKFITGISAPTTGLFTKGDICWNSNPVEFNYVGWVCVSTGEPGTWLPFGAIARQ
jgi:hypothetical protein